MELNRVTVGVADQPRLVEDPGKPPLVYRPLEDDCLRFILILKRPDFPDPGEETTAAAGVRFPLRFAHAAGDGGGRLGPEPHRFGLLRGIALSRVVGCHGSRGGRRYHTFAGC
jgi:hypothetical protein